MPRTRITAPLLCLLTLLPLSACASSSRDDGPKPPTLAEWDDLSPIDHEPVFLGAQPSEAALDQFLSRGGRMVINLRTDKEMAYLPYYDRAVTSRGLSYVRIPSSGSTLGPATVAALDDALAGAGDRPVLLHCASGGRATYAWAMRKMTHEGLTADEAAAWVAEQRGEISDSGRERLQSFATDLTQGESAPEGGED